MLKTIVLLGYMGAGKSAIGALLGDFYHIPFVDLDSYIEAREKRRVSEIFSENGELSFRKIERKYLIKCFQNKQAQVLSLGGGTPCYYDNMDLILKTENVYSFYLKTSVATLVGRLFPERGERPLIAHIETREMLSDFIGKHLFERVPFYHQADFTIGVDGKSIAAISDEIKSLLV